MTVSNYRMTASRSVTSKCVVRPSLRPTSAADGGDPLDGDGFFDTGDIATLDADSRVHIIDRAKDVIKSGGEWISSIDVENTAMGHPDVAEAAVIGITHPKWDERPLLIVVRQAGHDADQGIRARVPEWPDRQMVDARRCRLRRGDSAHRDRQESKSATSEPNSRITNCRRCERRIGPTRRPRRVGVTR